MQLTLPGVPEDQIIGIRYGLAGFYNKGAKPVTLTRQTVDGIHLKGGTMLVRAAGLPEPQRLLMECPGDMPRGAHDRTWLQHQARASMARARCVGVWQAGGPLASSI
jgi:hypothetical protein